MKTIVCFCLLLVAAQLNAAEFVKDGSEYVYRDTLRFEEAATGISSLDCESVNGTLELTGEERGTVSVTAFIEIRAENLKDGQKYLENFRPVVKREGNTVRVYGEYPDEWSWDEISANMDFVVLAPRTLKLDASCANGEISATGMQGDAELSCANGEIRFFTTDGPVGKLDASCANGEITVQVAELRNDCDFSTANGEISVTVLKTLAANISASTANGEVEIAIPAESSVRIAANSLLNGSIETDWGNASSDGLFGESAELAVNDGRYKIECSTLNGTVSVRKSNQAN